MTSIIQGSVSSIFQFRVKAHLRFWEIDVFRGIAIVMMVIYHLMWDLLFFGLVSNVALQQGFWKYFQRTTASTFLLLVGVGLAVSYMRDLNHNNASLGKYLWRGAKIFGWGMVLSVIVRVADVGRIDFGVLHLIGVSVILAYPFLAYRWLNIGLWILLNVVGYFLQPLRIETIGLVWLGLKPTDYFYLDYFPLIPWFGVVLLGIGVGNLLYDNNQRTFSLPDFSNWRSIQFLQWLGRRSLAIYLVHQPLLFALLFVLFWLIS